MTLLLHPDFSDYKSSCRTWILGWILVLLLVLYMAFLPKQIDVRSNGTVGIKTFLLTFHIDGIVRAYQSGLGREDFLRPRIRFATGIMESGKQHRVVLRRNHGRWDVVVTPADVEGFLEAVEEMIKVHGADDDYYDTMIDVENNCVAVQPTLVGSCVVQGKPDLAATDETQLPPLV